MKTEKDENPTTTVEHDEGEHLSREEVERSVKGLFYILFALILGFGIPVAVYLIHKGG